MAQEKKLSAVAVAVQSHGADIVATVGAQIVADDRWVKLARAMHKDGVPSMALVKGTEKSPNKNYDEDAYAALRSFVIMGINAKKKPESFAYAIPGSKGADQVNGKPKRWTFADIVATDAAWLRENDASDTFRAVRSKGLQKIDQMIGKIIGYLQREEDPDKGRGAKGKGKGKDEAKIEAKLPETWQACMQYLTHMQAKAATMPISEGGQPLSAKEIADMQDALATMLANLRRHVK